MGDTGNLVLAIVIGTLVVLSLILITGFLMVVNSRHRYKHRQEMEELRKQRDQEVMNAERAAMMQTLADVGKELHDNVGQLLTVAQAGVRNALLVLPTEEMVKAEEAVTASANEVRRLGRDLNDDRWKQRSLYEAICVECERIERVMRVKLKVEVHDDLPMLPPDTTIVLYRIFQEIVNNALKHSGSGVIRVDMSGTERLLLIISDEGRGFDVENTEASSGLLNIPKRCALIGFEATCESRPGQGTSWRLLQKEAVPA